jgi:phage-related minor tail protein
MLRLTGPAITAIGHGIGELGAQFGVLMSKFSQKNVINAINIAFKILDVTMGGVIRMVQNAMNWWDEMSAAVKNTRNWVNDAIKEFGILRHETANIFDGIKQDVSRIWDQMWNATVSADVHGVSRVVSEIGRLPGQAIHAIASLPGMMRSAGANAMNWLLGGIESAASRVLSFISGIGGEIAAHLRSALSVSIPGIGHIGFAQGGVIDEPIVGFGLRSGMSYSFGEDGPETITPGTGHYGGGGGGDTYIINVPESATNPDQYGLRLIQVIRDYKRHHGNAATGIG